MTNKSCAEQPTSTLKGIFFQLLLFCFGPLWFIEEKTTLFWAFTLSNQRLDEMEEFFF